MKICHVQDVRPEAVVALRDVVKAEVAPPVDVTGLILLTGSQP